MRNTQILAAVAGVAILATLAAVVLINRGGDSDSPGEDVSRNLCGLEGTGTGPFPDNLDPVWGSSTLEEAEAELEMDLPEATAAGWSFLRVNSVTQEGAVNLLYQCPDTGTHMLLGIFPSGLVTPQQESVPIDMGDRNASMIVGPGEERVLTWEEDDRTFMARFVLSDGFGEAEITEVARSLRF